MRCGPFSLRTLGFAKPFSLHPRENDMAWWRGAVFYQVYPRSFASSEGRGTGDLRGVTERLPYVASLGVDAVWLSPFFASPMADYGYDVSDYRAVDPMFGTLADLDALLARAHGLGLRVVIDQVYAHTSHRHAWFEESRRDRANPRANWYVWADPKPDGSPPNNWQANFGGPSWTWEPRRRQYYLHDFLAEQPDLNFHEPAVREAILDTARFWLDRGVDGFRLDVVNYYFHDAQLRDNPSTGGRDLPRPRHYQHHVHDRSQPETLGFVRELRALTDSYEDRFMVGEVDSTAPVERAVQYTQAAHLHTAYSFAFLWADDVTPASVRAVMEGWAGTEAWPSWSFSNHDVARVASRFGAEGRPARARTLLALLLSLRGTIFLYQGEELGLPQAEVPFERMRDPEGIAFYPEGLGRDGCRTPMPWTSEPPHGGFSTEEPWLPVDPRHLALSVEAQEADDASTLAFTRRFLALRRRERALVSGEIAFEDTPDEARGLSVFTRTDGADALVCAFDLGGAGGSLSGERFLRAALLPTGLGGTLTDGTLRVPPDGGAVVRLLG